MVKYLFTTSHSIPTATKAVSLISINETLSKQSYFLSNPEGFFYRHADTGFKSKWAGFWAGDKKLIEFFDFRVGGEFLGEHNCVSLYYDFLKAIHCHELPTGEKINQKIWMPRQKPFLVLELLSKKEIDAELEIAFNFRGISENAHHRKYSVLNGKKLSVENEAGKCVVSVLKGKSSFEPREQYSTHFPKNEEQDFFVPGLLKLSGKRIVVQIASRKFIEPMKNELLHKHKRVSKTAARISTDETRLNRTIEFSVKALDLLRVRNGYIAGLPWFQQAWGRDLFWSLPAMTELGLFEECRESLLFFASASRKGQIPNYVFGKEKTFNSVDATPLYIIAAEKFFSQSNDTALLKKISKTLVACTRFIESRMDESDGFIRHDFDSRETWMDTLDRKEKAVEVQALCIKALESFACLKPQLSKISPLLKARAEWAEIKAWELHEEFSRKFFHKGFYVDRIYHNKKELSRTTNALVPLFLGLEKKDGVLNAFESEEFWTDRGPTTISKNSHLFNPESYHQGKTWSLCNGWMTGAQFLAGREEKAWKTFSLFEEEQWRDSIGCIGECWNSENLEQTGCPNQLWGNAIMLRVLFECAFGLKVNAAEKKLLVKPRIGSRIGKAKILLRVGGREGILKFGSGNEKPYFSLPGFKIIEADD